MRRFLIFAAILATTCAKRDAGGIRDDAGRTVAVPRRVNRIVTLAPNLTEILFAIGAGSRIVATDDFSDTPPIAKKLPKVGGVPPNVERIAAARPDLVAALTSGGSASFAPALATLQIPLYVVRTDRLDDVPRAMLALGAIVRATGAESAAANLRNEIRAQRRERKRPPRVMFAIWTGPLYVSGRATFADDLISLTGAHNVVQMPGWPQYSVEALVSDPPDLLLYPDKSVKGEAVEALFRSNPELRKRTTAVAVDENRFTRPGPQMARAAAELNAILDSWERGRNAMLPPAADGRPSK